MYTCMPQTKLLEEACNAEEDKCYQKEEIYHWTRQTQKILTHNAQSSLFPF